MGPGVLTLGASMAGVFPVAPRLTLFLLPALIVLLVAGLSEAVERLPLPARRPGLAVAAVVILLPLEFQAVVRTFAVEPSARFHDLVHELQARRRPGEPVYIFARSLPAWIYYSTDWSRPDSLRLAFLPRRHRRGRRVREPAQPRPCLRAGPSHRSLRPRGVGGAARPAVGNGVAGSPGARRVAARQRLGSVESRRIERAAHPAVWVLASGYYAPESELFTTLDRSAMRRSFVNVRNGSVLVRYEFAPAR